MSWICSSDGGYRKYVKFFGETFFLYNSHFKGQEGDGLITWRWILNSLLGCSDLSHLLKLNLHVFNLMPDRIWAHSSGYEECCLLGYIMKVDWWFGRTHSSIFTVKESVHQKSLFATCNHTDFLLRLLIDSWRWRLHVPLKCWLGFSVLHGVISQKIVLFLIPDILELGVNAQHLPLTICSYFQFSSLRFQMMALKYYCVGDQGVHEHQLGHSEIKLQCFKWYFHTSWVHWLCFYWYNIAKFNGINTDGDKGCCINVPYRKYCQSVI
jgi:hypothetical protein